MKNGYIRNEEGVHGERWQTLHDGYFSDPRVASPFLDSIEKIINISYPSVIADLGGGTGFILSELSKRLSLSGVKLFNVDISSKQLSSCDKKQIALIKTPVSQFTRHQLKVEDANVLLIARSLLHYFGKSDLRHLLRHIRCQQKKGEFFIHQSACFQRLEDSECLNLIYNLMGIDKWYGTISKMQILLEEVGWEICTIIPAPNLHLNSRDLSERYNLSPDQVKFIRIEIEKQYGQSPDIFCMNDIGFDAYLHYCIFICRAI